MLKKINITETEVFLFRNKKTFPASPVQTREENKQKYSISEKLSDRKDGSNHFIRLTLVCFVLSSNYIRKLEEYPPTYTQREN